MKRREFFSSSAAVIGSGILPNWSAFGQTIGVAAPIRTARLVDDSTLTGTLMSQDSIFDGKNIVYLYRNGFQQTRGMKGTTPSVAVGFSPNSRFAVTATDTSGKLLWSYPLPQGNYLNLGTHDGSVAICALRYVAASGGAIMRPVLLLDPPTAILPTSAPMTVRVCSPMLGTRRFSESSPARVRSGR